ncbi:MAG: sortase B protein-sorting domain-containing protein [Patescibacteria group bacterium]
MPPRIFSLIIAVLGLALFFRPAGAAAPVSINPPSAPVAVSRAELKLQVTVDQITVTPPSAVQLTFIVTNTGATAAQGVAIDNLLPVEFRYRDPDAAKQLTRLGNLAPGDTITKNYIVDIPASVKTNRYVNEAVASAANADSVQTDAALNITNGQVLGASDQLAETGQSPAVMFLVGILLLVSGLVVIRRVKTI